MNDGVVKNKIRNRKIIILLLTVALIGLIIVGIFSYFDYVNKKVDYQNIDINDPIVSELIHLTRNDNRFLFAGTKYENLYYSTEKIDMKSFDLEFKLLLSYITIDPNKIDDDGDFVVVKEEDLKKQYTKIFGDDNYKGQDIEYSCPTIISYNPKEKRYEYNEFCGGGITTGYENKIIEARKYDNKIEIYEKVAFYLFDEDYESITYWENSDYTDLIVETSIDEEFNVDEYLQNMKTYKFVFERKENNYYFKSVELVK